ncbi:MAG: RNA 2',3'-cyclic phosphodiesterase [Sphingomicrobium sp.]
MIRLFVALPCPPELEDALIEAQDGIEGMRWVPTENLHCTLRFIGEVERPVAEDVAVALEGVSATSPTIRLAGVGVFDRGRSGAVWARVAPKETIQALHRKIDRAIVRCGLRPEGRSFIPHITLGRWSRGPVESTRWADRWAGLESAPVRIPDFQLYESVLGNDGPTYQPRLSIRLRS